MFRCIHAGVQDELFDIAPSFVKEENEEAALLSFDYAFTSATLEQMSSMPSLDLVDRLYLFHSYVQLLARFSARADPIGNMATARLFNIKETAENGFCIPRSTWLYEEVKRAATSFSGISVREDGIQVMGYELQHIIQHTLRDRIKDRVLQQEAIARTAAGMVPCPRFAVFGFCKDDHCQQEHQPSVAADGYNVYVRLNLLEIMICQVLGDVPFEQRKCVLVLDFHAHPSVSDNVQGSGYCDSIMLCILHITRSAFGARLTRHASPKASK